MFKIRGFRASFDFLTKKQRGFDVDVAPVSISGAYRTTRDEYNNNNYVYKPPKQLTPSMVQLPKSRSNQSLKSSKSTGDLTNIKNLKENVSPSIPDLHSESKQTKSLIKEQKKLEKQRRIEQKKQEKIAAKEILKQEKEAANKLETEIRKKRQKTSDKKNKTKKIAPLPPQSVTNNKISSEEINISTEEVNQVIQGELKINEKPKTNDEPTVNDKPIINKRLQATPETLEISISRSAVPPTYGEFPEIVSDESGNVSFRKPVVNSSWDLITQHRQEMKRPTITAPVVSRKIIDLQYNVGNLRIDNSEA